MGTPPLWASASVALAAALLSAPTLEAGAMRLQPGEQWNGNCTLAFVFDGVGPAAGRVFMGTAAHCATALGEVATVPGLGRIGVVAYRGDPAWSPGAEGPVDFALIEIDPALHALVVADVKGHAGLPRLGPTAEDETRLGDVLLVSGHGLGVSATEPTREDRAGALLRDDARGYRAALPIAPGDSGGPVLHAASGRALGTVTGIVVRCCGAEVGELGPNVVGPTLEGALADAAAAGIPVVLRLAG